MGPRKISIEEFEKWLSVKDTAHELGLSRQGVRDKLAARTLRGAKTSIGWLLDPASVRKEHLLRRDKIERKRREEREALIRRASEGHEVSA